MRFVWSARRCTVAQRPANHSPECRSGVAPTHLIVFQWSLQRFLYRCEEFDIHRTGNVRTFDVQIRDFCLGCRMQPLSREGGGGPGGRCSGRRLVLCPALGALGTSSRDRRARREYRFQLRLTENGKMIGIKNDSSD
jgi:hypothetical protein